MRKNLQQIRTHALIFSIIIFICAVIIALILWLFDSRKTATIDILVAPTTAHINIGDQTFKNGTHRIEPGTYQITITQDGFNSYTTTLTLISQQTTPLYTYLLPADGSYQWYLDHPADDMILNSIGDQQADTASHQYASIDPIFNLTPYTDPSNRFRIDAQPSNGTDPISLSIFLNTCSDFSANSYQTQALRWLNDHHINPSSYHLTYSSLCDPSAPPAPSSP